MYLPAVSSEEWWSCFGSLLAGLALRLLSLAAFLGPSCWSAPFALWLSFFPIFAYLIFPNGILRACADADEGFMILCLAFTCVPTNLLCNSGTLLVCSQLCHNRNRVGLILPCETTFVLLNSCTTAALLRYMDLHHAYVYEAIWRLVGREARRTSGIPRSTEGSAHCTSLCSPLRCQTMIKVTESQRAR